MSYYQHVTLSTWCLCFCSCMVSDCIDFTVPLGQNNKSTSFVLFSAIKKTTWLLFSFFFAQSGHECLLFLTLQKNSRDTHTFLFCMEKKTVFNPKKFTRRMKFSYENNLNYSTFLILRWYVCKEVVCQWFLYWEVNFRSSVSKREYFRLTILNFSKRWSKIHGLTEGLENYIPDGKFYGHRKNCVSEIPVS